MLLRYLAGAVFVFLAGMANADEDAGPRNILSYGCHKGDGTCYVNIDGPAVTGSPDCIANQLRWDASSGNGKSWLAMIMTAAATGKKVNFYVSGCFSPGAPTFTFGSVYQ